MCHQEIEHVQVQLKEQCTVSFFGVVSIPPPRKESKVEALTLTRK